MNHKLFRIGYFLLAYTMICTAYGNTGKNIDKLSASWLSIRNSIINEPYPSVRIEGARVAASTVVDPPVDASNFDKYMAASFALSGSEFRERIIAIFEELQSKMWTRTDNLKGYSKTRVRIVGAPNKVLLEFFIRIDDSAIRFDGHWYKLEIRDIRRFTDTLFGLAKEVLEDENIGVKRTKP